MFWTCTPVMFKATPGVAVSIENAYANLRFSFSSSRRYTPGRFRYRVHADISDGARNFHFLLQCSMRVDAVDRDNALDVLKKIGFLAHGQNIPVGMLLDKR